MIHLKRRFRGVTAWVLILGCHAGCIGLTPYQTILETKPKNDFIRVGGQWIHIERNGEGDPLLLLHGFGGSTFTFHKVADQLAKSFDVIAIDLNGFGYTQRPTDAGAYAPEGQVALVISVMDRFGLREAHVLGHSYGAGIAMLLAAEHRDRVASLVLVDGDAPRGGFAMIPRELLPLTAAFIETFIVSEQTVRDGLTAAMFRREVVTDELVQGYYEPLLVEGLGDAICGLLSAANGMAIDFDFGAVQSPSLILWGAHDPIIPIAAGEALHELLPESEFERIERSGHFPMEEEPEVFVEKVAAFLTK